MIWTFLPGFSLDLDILCRSIFTDFFLPFLRSLSSWQLLVEDWVFCVCVVTAWVVGKRGSSAGAVDSGVVGWFLLFFYNFVNSLTLEYIPLKWGHILFPWVGSSGAWIISPVQGRIIGTICPGVYFPHLTQLFPAATLTPLPDKGRKR